MWSQYASDNIKRDHIKRLPLYWILLYLTGFKLSTSCFPQASQGQRDLRGQARQDGQQVGRIDRNRYDWDFFFFEIFFQKHYKKHFNDQLITPNLVLYLINQT